MIDHLYPYSVKQRLTVYLCPAHFFDLGPPCAYMHTCRYNLIEKIICKSEWEKEKDQYLRGGCTLHILSRLKRLSANLIGKKRQINICVVAAHSTYFPGAPLALYMKCGGICFCPCFCKQCMPQCKPMFLSSNAWMSHMSCPENHVDLSLSFCIDGSKLSRTFIRITQKCFR